MALHDFAPAWLNFPTPPPSTKTSLNSDKHSESLARPESRYNVIRRRRNSSDAFDAALGRSNGGNSGRKEKTGWRSQGRNGSENGTGPRSRSSTFHGGKSHGHHDGRSLENKTTRKDDRERRKQFEAEDFPSLNPEHDKEEKQNKSLSAGVWEYPLNSKSRSSRMLVIRKGMKDDFSLSGYPVTTSAFIPPVKNGTNLSKDLPPQDTSPEKDHSNVLMDENQIESSSDEPFRPNKRIHMDLLEASQAPAQEDCISSSFSNGIRSCCGHDVNLNFEKRSRNSVTSCEITRSSTFPHEVVLSSSLEAEHRLLKEMGWQEDGEDDETYAPLTEDEMREFQAISEQLQKNGLRKSGLLRNGLSYELKFDIWKYSTFSKTGDNNETETSSSDTSDDDF